VETINTYRILAREYGRPRKLEDNIKVGNTELGYEDGRWMELAQDRVQWRALV
jgi:hypothetical protein